MRGLAVVAALALPALGAGDAADAADDASFPIDLDEARAAFETARALSDADGGALWGKRLYGPMLFVDPGSRAVVANAADGEGRLEKRGDDLYAGRLPDEVGIANTTTVWAGRRWAMVMWPIPAEPAWRGALLMHESFHRIQPRLGIPLAMPGNHHLDTADGRLWLRLEWRALVDALSEGDPAASDALRDALVFRAYRRALIPGAAEEERALELNEGLAEYTGLRLSGADDAARRRRVIEALEAYDRSPTLMRSFAYASGPAYGEILDAARPGWPRRIRRTSDYGDMLAKAIGFRPPDDLAAAARERAGLYDFAAVSADEAAREAERRTRAEADRARFLDGPVLVLDLTGKVGFTFSPHAARSLDGTGTVHRSLHVTAPWGTLDAASGALMIEDPPGHRRVQVPAPDPASLPPAHGRAAVTITGDGWRLDLAPGWTLAPGPRDGDWHVVLTGRRRETRAR